MFLAKVVNWDGNNNILSFGVAIGLVLFALGYILRQSGGEHGSHARNDANGGRATGRDTAEEHGAPMQE